MMMFVGEASFKKLNLELAHIKDLYVGLSSAKPNIIIKVFVTFVSCWMSFVMDRSQFSMRDLFKRLNVRGIDMDISTFSKTSKSRDVIIFIICF
jgi:hypothetical protein